jgi:hypothetical protein
MPRPAGAVTFVVFPGRSTATNLPFLIISCDVAVLGALLRIVLSNLLDFPVTFSPRLNSHFFSNLTTKTNTYKMFDEKNIESALAEMNTELNPNELAIARKWNVDHTNLKKWFLG